MSVVIIGGNECMVCQYEKICKDYGCKAKVFAKEKGCLRKKLGNPDLMILFTNTVSQKWSIPLYQRQRKIRFGSRECIPAVRRHSRMF